MIVIVFWRSLFVSKLTEPNKFTLSLEYWDQDKMADTAQTLFFNSFFLMKIWVEVLIPPKLKHTFKYHWNWVLIPIWQRNPPCRSVWWLFVEETTGVDGIKQTTLVFTWRQRIKVSAISHWIDIMYVFFFLNISSCWSLSYFVMVDDILIPA